jgi:hypothetical protein
MRRAAYAGDDADRDAAAGDATGARPADFEKRCTRSVA